MKNDINKLTDKEKTDLRTAAIAATTPPTGQEFWNEVEKELNARTEVIEPRPKAKSR